ncbi:MAG: helix-turn-helix domain-containing protein [Bryobacteraceae bacterium]|nr:helix-turn-helix domain-containing protein [Bryobacteraceae bacterium]
MPVRIDAAYLTTEEVAHMLRIDERTVRKHLAAWRDSGGNVGLPGGFKIGSDWRIKRDILEDWIRTNLEMNSPSAVREKRNASAR